MRMFRKRSFINEYPITFGYILAWLIIIIILGLHYIIN